MKEIIWEGPSVSKEMYNKVNEWPEIVRLKATMFRMQICTTIPPSEKHTINSKLKSCGLAESGTSSGWVLDEAEEPVECVEAKGKRWHYMCVC